MQYSTDIIKVVIFIIVIVVQDFHYYLTFFKTLIKVNVKLTLIAPSFMFMLLLNLEVMKTAVLVLLPTFIYFFLVKIKQIIFVNVILKMSTTVIS